MPAPSVKVAGHVRDEAQTVDYEVGSPPAVPSQKPNSAPPAGSATNLLLPHIDVNIDFESRIYWAAMRPSRHPMITMELLQDMMCVQESVRAIMEEGNREQHQHLEYFVAASQTPGVYNFGGNLAYFADCIRRRDRESLRKYAYACIDVVYGNAMAFHTPVITIALVQGDALGGGFECALSFDVLVAEKSAKLGLPEVLFNLFPGMGAYSFLSRKIGTAAAEKLIMSGTVYTAEELHRLGVVDILADDGQGENAVRDYIARNRRKHNAHKAMYRSKRRINPLTYEELSDIVDIWLDAAMDLGEQDLRKMTRLVEAQARRFDKET
ncbi:crotonase/enoyl-CoA hydratase family protein [Microvirga terrae]|uniref:Crotonase/enoyl-CoA hydratase family protein n=1 Tax=Microvirga terrae TaxID=2740529 RepID=A0ABY5RRH9_9HYPH|nr:crotonase/enoyl-CoA hydratase family protein [Microvirga terrae]UVF18382.1 crotonase/enoyl-CoA hydratase family protein [Microvirga terrae]